MNKRTANVDQIYTIGLSNSAIFNIGDANEANPVSRAIAVQKEGPTLQRDLSFEDYSIFQRKANWPNFSSTVKKRTVHHNPTINVQQVALMAVSSSSIFQVGSLNKISAETRIKHFRILLDENENEEEENEQL